MIKIENIPVEKIIIGDEEFEVKNSNIMNSIKIELEKFGIKRPFFVTKVGENYMIYNSLNTFTAAKNIGIKEVPCKIISNKMMNNNIKELNFHRRGHEIKLI